MGFLTKSIYRMKIIFGSHNENKVQEIRQILGSQYMILSLKDVDWHEEIDETGDTLEANALIKMRAIYDKFKTHCFAEDTGLEIEALDNQPGVYTARYAGQSKDPDANMNLVLKNLTNVKNRKARFRTIIALNYHDKEYLIEGILKGSIALQKKGNHGFGYDPIFIPEAMDTSLAELSSEEKNKISHRKKAIQSMINFIQSHE